MKKNIKTEPSFDENGYNENTIQNVNHQSAHINIKSEPELIINDIHVKSMELNVSIKEEFNENDNNYQTQYMIITPDIVNSDKTADAPILESPANAKSLNKVEIPQIVSPRKIKQLVLIYF